MSQPHPFIAEVRLPILQTQLCTRVFLPIFDSHRICGDHTYGYLALRESFPPQEWHDPLVPGLPGPRTLILGIRTLHEQCSYARMIRCCSHCEIPESHDYHLGRAVPQDTGLVQHGLGKVASAALLARYWPTVGLIQFEATNALMGGLLRHEGWNIYQTQQFVQGIADCINDLRFVAFRQQAVYIQQQLHTRPSNAPGFRKMSSLFRDRGKPMVQTLIRWLDLKKKVIEVNMPQTITARDWDRIGDSKEESIIFKLNQQRRERLRVIEDVYQKESPNETLEMLIDREYSSLQARGFPS